MAQRKEQIKAFILTLLMAFISRQLIAQSTCKKWVVGEYDVTAWGNDELASSAILANITDQSGHAAFYGGYLLVENDSWSQPIYFGLSAVLNHTLASGRSQMIYLPIYRSRNDPRITKVSLRVKFCAEAGRDPVAKKKVQRHLNQIQEQLASARVPVRPVVPAPTRQEPTTATPVQSGALILTANQEKTFLMAIENDDTGPVAQLLRGGVNVNARLDRASGVTMLIHAAGRARNKIAALLLQNGADVNAVADDNWDTALWACTHSTGPGSPESLLIFRALIQHGADLSHVNRKRRMTVRQDLEDEIRRAPNSNGAYDDAKYLSALR